MITRSDVLLSLDVARSKMSCQVDECDGKFKALGFCDPHYRKYVRYGDPLFERKLKACKVKGCRMSHVALGYCNMHYTRFRTHGDPLVVSKRGAKPGPRSGAKAAKAQHLNNRGYLIRSAMGHPLATKHHQLLVHRGILFDAIGDQTHLCHLCGITLSWWSPQRANDYLTVDHVDGDKTNNVLENLKPACQKCNTWKGGGR